jgi:peroxiredoxin
VPDITAAGATLVVLSPQVEKLPREGDAQRPLPFMLLRDRGNQVATKYGLTHRLPDDLKQFYVKFGIDLAKANGDESWTLPIPARFVIDRTGIIRQADADPDYTHRSEPATTIDVLKQLT